MLKIVEGDLISWVFLLEIIIRSERTGKIFYISWRNGLLFKTIFPAIVLLFRLWQVAGYELGIIELLIFFDKPFYGQRNMLSSFVEYLLVIMFVEVKTDLNYVF